MQQWWRSIGGSGGMHGKWLLIVAGRKVYLLYKIFLLLLTYFIFFIPVLVPLLVRSCRVHMGLRSFLFVQYNMHLYILVCLQVCNIHDILFTFPHLFDPSVLAEHYPRPTTNETLIC